MNMKVLGKGNGPKILTILVLFIIVTSSTVTAYSAMPTDIKGHWAEDIITKWIKEGKVSGYEDGTFRPDNPINRAEFMVLVNNALGFTKLADVAFLDVPVDAWYVSHVAKAVAAGYISGYPDGCIRPEANMSREEVAFVLANIKGLIYDVDAAERLNDAHIAQSWSKGAIGAVVKAGYMGGYFDQTFRPRENITRAEAIVALDSIPRTVVYDSAGIYGPEAGQDRVDADVLINEGKLVLQNIIITGDLIIGEGVGEGTVSLNNVTVEGDTIVKCSSDTSAVIIKGGSYGNVTVRPVSDCITHIMADNAESIDIILSEGTSGNKVVLKGSFDSVTVDARDITLETRGETLINILDITADAEDVSLFLNEGTTVIKLYKEESMDVDIGGEASIREIIELGGKRPKKDTGKPSIGIKDERIVCRIDGADNPVHYTELKEMSDDTKIISIMFTVDANNIGDIDFAVTKIDYEKKEPRHPFVGIIENRIKRFRTKAKDIGVSITVAELFDFAGYEDFEDVGYEPEKDKDSVKLGSLRNVFGRWVRITGTVSADGFKTTEYVRTIPLS